MRPHLILACSFFLLTMAPLAAQTITSADAPMAGGQLHYINVDGIGTFSSGAAQTWTINGVTGEATVVDLIAVASAPGSANFPLATVAASSDDGEVFTFFRTNAGGLDIIGTYLPLEDYLEYYSDADRWIPYPCSYGTTWTDSYTVLDGPGGNELYSFGPQTWTADGYGTLVGPGGAMTNVLKTHQESFTSEIIEGDVFENANSTDRFWKPGYSAFIAALSSYSISINGVVVAEGSNMTVINELSSGIRDAEGNAIGMDIYPNPSTRSDVTLDYGSASATTVRVINSAGQLIYEEALGDRGPGIHRVDLPTAQLGAGLYQIELRNSTSERGSVRLVVE